MPAGTRACNEWIAISRYDPGSEAHQGFVFDSIMAREDDGGRWPYEQERSHDVRARMHKAFRHFDTRILVASVRNQVTLGGRPVMVACAAVNKGVIVYAFTRFKARRNGYATRLLDELEVDTIAGRPVPVLFWSPAASRIAAGGKHRIYPIAADDWRDHV